MMVQGGAVPEIFARCVPSPPVPVSCSEDLQALPREEPERSSSTPTWWRLSASRFARRAPSPSGRQLTTNTRSWQPEEDQLIIQLVRPAPLPHLWCFPQLRQLIDISFLRIDFAGGEVRAKEMDHNRVSLERAYREAVPGAMGAPSGPEHQQGSLDSGGGSHYY